MSGLYLEPVPPYLVRLHDLVEQWSSLGVKEFGDGTRLVGHLPEKGIGAFLHHLFGPLPEDLVEVIEEQVQVPLPTALKEFYRHHNGCILFEQAVFVFGLRRSYDRSDFDAMACNPFDIGIPTVTNRDRSPSGRGIAISRYEDRSVVFIEPDGTVCRVLDGTSHRANVWENFGIWLMCEYQRLEPFFDARGKCAVARLDTVPQYPVA